MFGGRVFQYFIDTLFELLASHGVAIGRFAEAPYRAPIVHLEADYVAPLRFADPIAVEIAEVKLGTSSFTIGYRIVHPDDAERVFCTGKMVHVFVDAVTMRKCAPPEEWRRALAPAST